MKYNLELQHINYIKENHIKLLLYYFLRDYVDLYLIQYILFALIIIIFHIKLYNIQKCKFFQLNCAKNFYDNLFIKKT